MMEKKGHNFRKLDIWKDSMTLVKEIYLFTETFPNSEKFNLCSQIQRCSISIPSNIAEGSGRGSEVEFIRFLKIAITSSYELETQVILAGDLFSIKVNELLNRIQVIQLKIGGFIRKLKMETVVKS
ncbi:MAG TPA: four helix bundle protein [Crocinitomicaceae bacterium]|nr:four helix bundle protein [Crocinitomicaceae bacterium]